MKIRLPIRKPSVTIVVRRHMPTGYSERGYLISAVGENTCTAPVQGTPYAKADKQQLASLFQYLGGCLEQIVKDNELGALKQALKVRRAASLSGVWL